MKVSELTADLSFSWQNILQQLTTSPRSLASPGCYNRTARRFADFEFVRASIRNAAGRLDCNRSLADVESRWTGNNTV
jgi:hypothetical protein